MKQNLIGIIALALLLSIALASRYSTKHQLRHKAHLKHSLKMKDGNVSDLPEFLPDGNLNGYTSF